MDLWNVRIVSALCLSAALHQVSDGVLIEDLRVPAVVEHDVNATAVLDCVYRIKRRESGLLTVKWFFKNETNLVYQWGKGLPPASSGPLKGRLVLDENHSQNDVKRLRALVIRNPTIELSGNYICKVATRENVVSGSKKMIVYAPARTMNLTQDRPTPTSVNVTCLVEGAFPVPRLHIFMKQESRQNRIRLKSVILTTVVTPEGVYDASAHVHLQDRDIDPQTLFECVMTIPDTQYSLKRVITYHSGVNLADSATTVCGQDHTLQRTSLFAALLMFCWPR